MKALSICQPYASAIIHGPKRVENRTWPTRHRGPLLIHAGASRAWMDALDPEQRRCFPQVEQFPHLFGALIGVAFVEDCSQYVAPNLCAARLAGDPWAAGPWCWVLFQRVIPLDRPIPFRGRQRIFNVPDELLPTYITSLVKDDHYAATSTPN